MTDFDYIIVGGGLQGGLLVRALTTHQPTARIALFERHSCLGGNHTWSFHALDVPAQAAAWVEPLVCVRWPAYTVRFPKLSRRVDMQYAAILSERLAQVVAADLDRPGCRLHLGSAVQALTATTVTLTDGRAYSARCVVDARGPTHAPVTASTGYQKFLGWEVELAAPWPESVPTLMDATGPQTDGFSFVYTLPFTPTRVLVEPTYFSDTAHLDRDQLRQQIRDYLTAHGYADYRLIREESGVLPMPWADASAGDKPTPAGPLRAGYAGGWFHPATGYSLPLAVRLAQALATVAPELAAATLKRLADRLGPRWRFARLLNRLLFTLVVPAQRYTVFRRLYRDLPDPSMARFYALELTCLDAARMVLGPPPPLAPLRLFRRQEATTCWPQPH
jgi:lycopene beta-cyclase